MTPVACFVPLTSTFAPFASAAQGAPLNSVFALVVTGVAPILKLTVGHEPVLFVTAPLTCAPPPSSLPSSLPSPS